MQQILNSVDFWKFVVPLIGAVLAWYVNEWQKRLSDQYQRKEANYKELLRSLQGFYENARAGDELKHEFLKQLSVSWLYCPDEVIRKAYAFLDTVHARDKSTDQVKQQAYGDFVLAVREDLLSRKLIRKTKLSSSDYRHYTVSAK